MTDTNDNIQSQPDGRLAAVAAGTTGSGLFYAEISMVGSSGDIYYRIKQRRRWLPDKELSCSSLRRDEAAKALRALAAEIVPNTQVSRTAGK